MSSTEELERTPFWRENRWSRLLVLLFASALYVGLALRYREIFRGNAVDDAYISFRYLDNLVAGHGLVYNVGERVEGYSNLLWILLLAPLRLLGANLVLGSQLLGLFFGILTLFFALVGAERLLSVKSWLGLFFVALLPATSGYFAAWSISGLEGTLYSCLLCAAWLRYHREQEEPQQKPFSALLFACLAMTRPEGLWLALLFAAFHLIRERIARGTFRDSAVYRFPVVLLLALLVYEALRFSYYGPHLLANSVRAKVGLSVMMVERGIAHLNEHFSSPYLIMLFPFVFLFRAKEHLALRTAVAIVAFHLCIVIAVGGDWSFGRLYAPLLPMGALALAGAWAALSRATEELRSFAMRMGALFVGSAYLVFAALVTGPYREMRFFDNFAPYDEERLLIGKWLAERAPKNAKVAAFAAGEIAWASGLYTHDMLGLNDPHIASIAPNDMGKGVPGHEKYDPEHTLSTIKPDIIIDAHLVPTMQEHPGFRQYELLPGFQYNSVYVTEEMAEILGPVPAEQAPPPPTP